MCMILISLIVIVILVFLYQPCRRRILVKQWYYQLALDKHHTKHQQLFATVNGYSLSRQARSEHDAIEYTYGEIEFLSFIALLSLVHPNSDTIFYDLGSGIGKAVIACAMVFNVNRSCGIELLNPLHDAALKQLQQLQCQSNYQEVAKKIHFIHADFLQTDFSDATLIFINASTFFGEIWIELNNQLQQMKPGVIIITTSKKLLSAAFIVTKATTVQMSWGPVSAYIQQRC